MRSWNPTLVGALLLKSVYAVPGGYWRRLQLPSSTLCRTCLGVADGIRHPVVYSATDGHRECPWCGSDRLEPIQ